MKKNDGEERSEAMNEDGRARILVVDDEAVIQMLLSSFLTDEGYDVQTASSAEEGLVLIDQGPVDIAIVDIRMGGMDGIGMLREIKKRTPETEVVISTSHASLETAVEALRLGAYDYLIKPFDDLDVVKFSIERVIEKMDLTRRNTQLLRDLEGQNMELSKAVKRLNSLINAGRAMSSIYELPKLLDYFVGLVSDELGAERVSLMLLDRGSNELRIAASRGISNDIVRTASVRVGEGIAGRVADMGKPILVKNVNDDPLKKGDADPDLSHSFISLPVVLSIPIKLKETILGVINVTNKKTGEQFCEDDMAFLSSLAGQAAVAIENARHFKDLQEAYESLKESQSRLVASERLNALGEMAAGVAHDFNNILTGVLGRAQIMLNRISRPVCDMEIVRSNLKVIEDCALQGAEAVRRIQSFARVRQDVPHEPVDMNKVVTDAVEISRHKWKNERDALGAPITVRMNLGPIPPVTGNVMELIQVTTNLIFNAVEAMPGGGTIEFSTARLNGSVVLEVTDSGTGMDEDVAAHVFEPFFTTKEKGNGLGLSIVFGIVQHHGGEITVRSRREEGTTFRVALPVRHEAGPVTEAQERQLPNGERPARVLVVDDDDIVRDVIGEMLRSCRHQVVLARSGDEALGLYMKGLFDLVITDFSMDGMSGLELAQQIRCFDPDVRIILCSGWTFRVTEGELSAAGVDAVLQKPAAADTLLDLVAKSLSVRADGGVGAA